MRRLVMTGFLALVVLSLSVGCLPEQGRPPALQPLMQSAVPITTPYTPLGAAPFVVVYTREPHTGFVVPTSVNRTPDETPLHQAVRLLSESNRHARIMGTSWQDSTLTLDMPAGFAAWITRNGLEERAFLQAAVLTFTNFEGIDNVVFTSGGLPLRGAVGSWQLASPISRSSTVNALSTSGDGVVVYLRLRDTDLLAPFFVATPQTGPEGALRALLAFSGHDRLVTPIPANVALRSFRISADGAGRLAIVNFDKASLSLFVRGSANVQIALDAVVYTLTEFEEIDEVLFMVDGRVLGPLGSTMDLSRSFRRGAINRITFP